MAGSDRPAGRSEALAREVAMEGWSRREFLGASAASVAVLSLSRLTPAAAPTSRALPVAAYGDWRDVYRGKWSWDRVAVGTHTNANCYGNCAWNLFVRDGIVWREEQSAPYRASNDTVPDFNPRGCQKGASFSDMMVGPARLSHPMRRLGPRGSGRWKRISWDEALEEVSVSLVDTLARRGGAGVIAEIGGNIDMGQAMIGTYRFLRQIGAPSTDYVAQLGDLPVGAQITLGVGLTGGSSDDWFRSDYVVNWTFNPAATRIPDAHFLNEARYRGGKVVTIAPDYSQSAIHADLWLSIRPGTDAALALAACQVVLAEGLYDAEYIREQTDLPFLVRADDGRFLREADVVAGGEDDVFAVWDEKADRLAWAPGSPGSSHQSLELPDGLRPALEKDGTALLASGERVRVRTVFSRVLAPAGEPAWHGARRGGGDHRNHRCVDPPICARLRAGELGADPLQPGRLQALPLRPDPARPDPARLPDRQHRKSGWRMALGRHAQTRGHGAAECARQREHAQSAEAARPGLPGAGIAQEEHEPGSRLRHDLPRGTRWARGEAAGSGVRRSDAAAPPASVSRRGHRQGTLRHRRPTR
jgi:hypothetical protein